MSETWHKSDTGPLRSFSRKILIPAFALAIVAFAAFWQGTTIATQQQTPGPDTQPPAAELVADETPPTSPPITQSDTTAPSKTDSSPAETNSPSPSDANAPTKNVKPQENLSIEIPAVDPLLLKSESEPDEPHHQEYFDALKKHSVFLGTKKNRIDLSEALANVDSLKNASVKLEIVLNTEPKVVSAKVDKNNILTFEYGELGESEVTIQATNTSTGHTAISKMSIEVWTPNYWKMVLTVIGGLGVFLLGMKYASEGLQAIAGASLRKLIATFTENRFLAVIVGMVATILVQSSTVTTVMVVGFINSQIMTLTQGIGVIMGANIGTTTTAWIISIKIGEYGLPLMGVCAFIYIFSKTDRIKYAAMAGMGLGAVFFGLELMTQGFSILRDLPEFAQWMERFSADTTWGVLKCAAIGCVLTLVVQSSAATLGITMSLAALGIIEFPTAAALVLGENVGTTLTAVLASIGTSVNAKRAAAFHVIFNMTGVLWVTTVFITFFLPTVYWIIGTNEAGDIKNIGAGIAMTHSLFNITNTLLFLPFSRIVAKLLIRVIPDKGREPQKQSLTNLNIRLLESSAIAIERSRIEVIRMSNGCLEMADEVKHVMQNETVDREIVEKAFYQEQVLDTLQDEIIEFMADMLSGNISHDIAENARSQLRMADELESISDYFIVIMKSNLKLRESDLMFPEQEHNEMLELHDAITSYFLLIHRAFSQRKTGMPLLTEVHSQGRNITHLAKNIRDKFLKKMSDERFDPQIVMAFNAQLNAYRRVREHAQNVAEAIVGVK